MSASLRGFSYGSKQAKESLQYELTRSLSDETNLALPDNHRSPSKHQRSLTLPHPAGYLKFDAMQFCKRYIELLITLRKNITTPQRAPWKISSSLPLQLNSCDTNPFQPLTSSTTSVLNRNRPSGTHRWTVFHVVSLSGTIMITMARPRKEDRFPNTKQMVCHFHDDSRECNRIILPTDSAAILRKWVEVVGPCHIS